MVYYLPPENTRKLEVFPLFQEVQKEIGGMKCVTGELQTIHKSFSYHREILQTLESSLIITLTHTLTL